jgi:small GTP-binding protein
VRRVSKEEVGRLEVTSSVQAGPTRPSNEPEAAIEPVGDGRRFHLVVLGTGPVGKTSLIGALLGRSAGETGPTMGTTGRGQTHTHVVRGLEGTLLLSDTPGLGEPGAEGMARETEALELATSADLLLFLVDYDLTRADHQALLDMARKGKRIIVALNKKDRLTELDREAILTKLHERLDGFVPAEDIVAVAAAPGPVPIRVRKADGTMETVLETEPPDLEALESRVTAVLNREGDVLRAGNLLLRARRRELAERDRIARQRRQQSLAVIERYQWLAAATAFANPVLVLGPMAAGAIQLKMLGEVAAIYDVPLSSQFVETLGGQMVQTLFKLGITEATASVLGGLLKLNPLGFVAGGAIQAVTMAYLTRLGGASFLDYLEQGQTWGDGGMTATLTRHLEASRRPEWFTLFAKSTLNHVSQR